LDENRLDEWFGLLDEQMVYEIPIRLTESRGGPDEYPVGAYRVRDDIAMIRKRIDRLATGEAWAETPPSRTVRVVGSIFAEPDKETDVYQVKSAILIYRQRAQDESSDLIPARRCDTIRVVGGDCTLLKRTVLLADTVLRTPNLGIFL